MSNLGYEIKNMNEDGACLFRSIADQVYGDQEFHFQVRQDCMNYIVSNIYGKPRTYILQRTQFFINVTVYNK